MQFITDFFHANTLMSFLPTTQRIEALDFLKCIFVLLMIAFHLAYFTDAYPLLKQWVYTFHMPGFLLISGYLMTIHKGGRHFLRTLRGLLVPYLLLEIPYICLSAVLPTREHIDHLTPMVFFDKLFLHPLGPYWYLHTMMLCGTVYFLIFRYVKLALVSRMLLLGLVFFALHALTLVAWDVSLYFALGVLLRQSGQKFTAVFRPSLLALPVLLLLATDASTFHKGTLAGMLTVYGVISLLLFVYPRLPQSLRRTSLFLGRNSLALFLFAPIFTMACKVLIPFLAFDDSHFLYLCLSLPISVVGALLICKVLDLLHLSRWIFFRKSALQ